VFKNAIFKIIFLLSVLVGGTGWTDWADPTEPSGFATDVTEPTKETEATTLILSAILISENNRIAVINNNVVKVGDKVGGDEVRSIESNEVKLMSKKGLQTLHLIDEKIKEFENERK
jgi:hypothetical protein